MVHQIRDPKRPEKIETCSTQTTELISSGSSMLNPLRAVEPCEMSLDLPIHTTFMQRSVERRDRFTGPKSSNWQYTNRLCISVSCVHLMSYTVAALIPVELEVWRVVFWTAVHWRTGPDAFWFSYFIVAELTHQFPMDRPDFESLETWPRFRCTQGVLCLESSPAVKKALRVSWLLGLPVTLDTTW